MTHLQFLHRSPEFVRLLLALAASIALVAVLYLTDASFLQSEPGAVRAPVPSPLPPASSALVSPDRTGGGGVAVTEPPSSAAPVIQASPAPVVQASASPAPRYMVRPGDSLIPIALYFGVRIEDLIALNKLPQDGFLYAGQELLIPPGPGASPDAGR